MPQSESTVLYVTMSDGVKLAMRVYGPASEKRPILLAASPYRFDNDDVPETTTFLWKETGPIDWYVERGFTYVHLDVRGTGRSEGEYEFLGSRERRDLYEVIEWIAQQPWSTGKIGGIGHSYYAASQWCMAAERPPHLSCIAPYDGGVDIYRQWTYHGGIQCEFNTTWWHGNVRPINLNPFAADAVKRDIPLDLPRTLSMHPLIDQFWKDRDFASQLDGCKVPVLSFGIWSKPELHLPGNLEGFNRVCGPKRLFISGAANVSAAQAQFESESFHEKHLLPFYERFLKGVETEFDALSPVTFEMREATQIVEANTWPPKTREHKLFLSGEKAKAANSLNDGSLDEKASNGGTNETSYDYPDAKWALGNVEFTQHGPNPTSLNLTFSSPPLEEALDVVGYPTLRLFMSSSRNDIDVIAKLVEVPASVESGQPKILSKGWLRASHRAILDRRFGIRYKHEQLELLEPEQIYELELSLTPLGHRFLRGSRIRLDLSCADSAITDTIFTHTFTPNTVGTDTVHHSSVRESCLNLPILLAESVTVRAWLPAVL